MPWCPKCNREYGEGAAICDKCGCRLIEEQRQDGPFYQDSSQKASDNRSSGWVFLAVGILGLAFVVLGILGVIPLRPGSFYEFYGVTGAVFLLFLVQGVISIRSASFFARKAESENSLRSTMLEWCRENLKAEEIDEKIDREGLPDEVIYLNRTAYLRERLNHQFVNLDQGFLEQFVEDQVYDIIFEDAEV